MQKHAYGWRKSPPDERDLRATALDFRDLPILEEVDPRRRMPPVVDQGDLGSCTSNAVESAVRYDRMLDGHPSSAPLSRLFLYYCERKLEGSLGQGDTGAYGRDGFKAAKKWGICTEHDWPYHIERFEEEPPPLLWKHAERHLLKKEYRAVEQNKTAIQAALSNDQTIAFGFAVFESFETAEVEETGVVPVPDESKDAYLGGHEVLMVGYLKDWPEHVLCRNSWGKGWGLEGYFLMPWAYLLDAALADDFRTIRRPADPS